jgi:hypothetical protein
MDEAGAWVTGLGTLVHEAIQDAISRRYPSAQFEVSSAQGDISGSCDALISTDDLGSHYKGTHVLWELKTMGTYNFDKQVGWNRMRSAIGTPEGPSAKAVAQAGMNALGIESENEGMRIETIIMGSVTFEALSVNKARNMDVDGVNRFLAEFEVPREEWEPLAQEELARMKSIEYTLSIGYLPNRLAVNDNNKMIELKPGNGFWQCDYCSYLSYCIQDGAEPITAMESSMEPRKTNDGN